jgi:hypothetical protein
MYEYRAAAGLVVVAVVVVTVIVVVVVLECLTVLMFRCTGQIDSCFCFLPKNECPLMVNALSFVNLSVYFQFLLIWKCMAIPEAEQYPPNNTTNIPAYTN